MRAPRSGTEREAAVPERRAGPCRPRNRAGRPGCLPSRRPAGVDRSRPGPRLGQWAALQDPAGGLHCRSPAPGWATVPPARRGTGPAAGREGAPHLGEGDRGSRGDHGVAHSRRASVTMCRVQAAAEGGNPGRYGYCNDRILLLLYYFTLLSKSLRVEAIQQEPPLLLQRQALYPPGLGHSFAAWRWPGTAGQLLPDAEETGTALLLLLQRCCCSAAAAAAAAMTAAAAGHVETRMHARRSEACAEPSQKAKMGPYSSLDLTLF